MKLTLPRIRLYSIILSLVIVSFFGGVWVGRKDIKIEREGFRPKVVLDRAIPQNHTDTDFSLFWDVWDRLSKSYFDKSKLDSSKMVYGAIRGMVAAVGDPYTVFLPPEDQKRTQEDLGGKFEGVGIQIGFKGSQLAVIAPLDGSPAAKADIKAGDFIVGIKDKNKNIDRGTVGISLPDAVDVIRGAAGTPVTLILTRDGKDKPFDIEVVRAKIDVPSVILAFEGKNKEVANLKLLKFGDQTDNEWNNAVLKIKSQKSKGMILDLRNNPGGYLNGAVNIASEFLNKGAVVIQEDGNGGRRTLSVTGKARLADIPLVILVNKGSASASEIVSGALKDYGRAKIVGDTTFGKGTVQESEEVGSSGLHITIAKWLTPKGTWINGTGLEPDDKIEDKADTPEDEQLREALKLLGSS